MLLDKLLFQSYKTGIITGEKIFQYCTRPTGWVTYNFHASCKHTHLALKCVCNKEHKGLPRVILPKALILQDECFGKNNSSFLDFTRNYEGMSGIFVPCITDNFSWSDRNMHVLCKHLYKQAAVASQWRANFVCLRQVKTLVPRTFRELHHLIFEEKKNLESLRVSTYVMFHKIWPCLLWGDHILYIRAKMTSFYSIPWMTGVMACLINVYRRWPRW